MRTPMPNDLYIETVQKPTSERFLRKENREQSPTEHHPISGIFVYDTTAKERGHKLIPSDLSGFFIVSHFETNLRPPWDMHTSENMFFDNINIEIKPLPLFNVDNYTRGFPIEDVRLLSQTDKALEFLCRRTEAMTEGLFYNISSIPPSRAPGFVIDGWLVIPEYDRELEYKIYKELANTIRNNPNLLFNIHVIARKGRDVDKILPKNCKKYSAWSDYVC